MRIAGTAIGATSFLACEAIGGTITLAYGFANAAAAIVAAITLMFLVGLPIAYHAAREGLDVDLLTRGAGFGYLGSTITSLIYASFTFLLFAIEASILSVALEMAFGIPIAFAHILSSLVVIPIALYGMSLISRMQAVTTPLWLLLQLAPIAYILFAAGEDIAAWQHYAGRLGAVDGSVDLLLFGLALSTLLSLLPQIGEQADYLRFLPEKKPGRDVRWWAAMLSGGPGWVAIGGVKLMLGSFLALFALSHGGVIERAASPTDMFYVVFRQMVPSQAAALALTGLLVLVCQMKINVTNAYAGSIAWSNFFSRLTHAHPGRVVWLVFNVLLALLLMEIGIIRVIEGILILYANLAAGWMGALSADLVISKPLGLSPRKIEFKRAHLYDINPVGVGAMGLSIIVSTAALAGLLGPLAHAFSPLLGLAVAFVAAPGIALATRGRFYIARIDSGLPEGTGDLVCTICENAFERNDMAYCPAYQAPICSLCCTLETRCHDMCKTDSRVSEQATNLLKHLLPPAWAQGMRSTIGSFIALQTLFTMVIGTILYLIYVQFGAMVPDAREVVATTLWVVFFALVLLSGIAACLIVLAHDSRRTAERDTAHQTEKLVEEIAAHTRTDAELQKAREVAENANLAKSRYLVGVSHEIRSPLNAIYGYAQLLERKSPIAAEEAGRVIRRSSEHLTDLVDGLLDISRIESGVIRLSSDTVPLPAFLDQIVDMFRMQAAAKGIEFRYARPEHMPAFVRTDEKRLRQILINLLSNAVKYTPAGHAALSIRFRSQVAEFEIVDTGVGIRPEDIERIFEPFDRGENDEARKQPGVGLGLAITRVLVQIMGGDIKVTSVPGEGSRFLLRLMLAEPREVPVATVRAKAIAGYAGARRTILLVDDDPLQLSVLQSLLRPLDFIVYAASNGAEGIALAERCQPDMILLDIQMPGLSGWETAAALRRAHGERARIVMVSANAHEFSKGGDGRADHDGFVMKPVALETLLDVVAQHLGLRWITAAAVAAPDLPPATDDEPLPLADAGPYVGELRRLGRIGHIRGIEAKLDEMEAALPDSRTLAERLRGRVKAFDLKAYLKMLEDRARG